MPRLTPTAAVLIPALLAAIAMPVLAGEGPDDATQAGSVTVMADSFKVDNKTKTLSASGNASVTIFPGKQPPVRNAPYSAEAVTEHTQQLSDGNQIVDRRSTLHYRDADGRTRRETRGVDGDMIVTIDDPVAAQTLTLWPRQRLASRAGQGASSTASAAGVRVQALRIDGDAPSVERRRLDDGSEAVVIKRVDGVDGNQGSNGLVMRDVRVQAAQVLAANSAALRDAQIRMEPLTAGAFGDMQWALKATTKPLGTRDVDGVKAEGKLRRYEIPAGAIGNRNPIVVSDETWTSPDLRITVYSKHSDPRTGETVFRLEKLKRDVPPAALFAVPADYRMR